MGLWKGKSGRRGKAAGGVRRRGIGLAWLLVAVALAVSLAVGACALWLPDRAPALLSAPREVTSAPASVQDYAGSQQVTVVPALSGDRELSGNASGMVTGDWSGDGLVSGRAAYKVNDRAVVALATATPLYRNLAVGDKGDDVLALNNELSRLGYNAVPGSDTYYWATSDGWHQLMVDNGNESDGSLSLSDLLWIPGAQVAVTGWQAVVGANVAAGQSVGQVPGSILSLTIKNGQPSEQDRTLTVFGQTITLPAGSIEITDAGFLAQVAASDEFKIMPAEALSAGLDASLSLTAPMTVVRVPAAAVFGVDGTSGCVAADDGTVIGVRIIGSQLGASLVEPEGVSPDSLTEVGLGSAIANATCPASDE